MTGAMKMKLKKNSRNGTTHLSYSLTSCCVALGIFFFQLEQTTPETHTLATNIKPAVLKQSAVYYCPDVCKDDSHAFWQQVQTVYQGYALSPHFQDIPWRQPSDQHTLLTTLSAKQLLIQQSASKQVNDRFETGVRADSNVSPVEIKKSPPVWRSLDRLGKDKSLVVMI
jgi:hypothetical protein